MLNEGYQPNKGELDVKNPPKGGSGVPNNFYKLGKCKILNLKKDDVIILNSKENISTEIAQHMIKQLKQTFPDNKAVVLCNGVELSVMRQKVIK